MAWDRPCVIPRSRRFAPNPMNLYGLVTSMSPDPINSQGLVTSMALAVLKAKIKMKNHRIRAGIAPKPNKFDCGMPGMWDD